MSGRIDDEAKILDALNVASKYGMTDGTHHKMWVIDQMCRHLLGDDYETWVKEMIERYGWENGIAP